MLKQGIEEKVHMWEGLKEYEINNTEDFLNQTEEGISGTIEILKKMIPNQYFVVATRNSIIKGIDLRDTRYFQRYIEKLEEEGLDIGKGDAEYGYKMPLPKNGETKRELIIFRRR